MNFQYKITISFIAFLFLTACLVDDSERGAARDTNVEMQLILNVPATVETKALTNADENRIETLDVLVFLDNGSGNDETYLYTTRGEDPQPGSGDQMTFRVPLKKSIAGEKHRLVLLANLRQELEGVKDAFTEMMSKEEVLEMITFDAYDALKPETERFWDTSTPRYLPMWGESNDTHVVTPTLQGYHIGTIHLLRSVATVDIVLNPDNLSLDPQGFGSLFKLKDVKVYNTYQNGYAVPDMNNITRTANSVKADEPTLPSSSRYAVAYTATPLTEQKGMTGEIYIAEANNTAGGSNIAVENQTCLVISGYYDGAGKETWYRLDFVKNKDTYQRWNILRNHRYRFYITSVDGPGYDTEQEAFESVPVNLGTEVVGWNEGDEIPDIDISGTHNLHVSEDDLFFYRDGRGRTITISTDHPEGWKVDEIVDGSSNPVDWITVTPDNGLMGKVTEVEISCSAIPSMIVTQREAWVIIRSGNVRKSIRIYQQNEEEYAIEITPTSLVFSKTAPIPKSVIVSVYPNNLYVFFKEVEGTTPPIAWLPGFGPGDYNGRQGVPGGLVLPFQPAPNSANKLLSGTVLIYTQDAQGNMISQQLSITQVATELLFFTTPENPYAPAGGDFILSVNSETDWAMSPSPFPAMIAYDYSIAYPAGDNTQFGFNLSKNNTWEQRTAILYPTSTHPEFSGQAIEIIQDYYSPELNVNPQEVNLGNTLDGTAAGLTVTSNAQWTVTGETGSASVYTTALPNPGGTNDPSTQTDVNLQFTPVSYNPAEIGKLPAAGELTTTATIETTNHLSLAPASKIVTVKRDIPAVFNFNNVPSPVARAGGNATVNVTTNGAWFAWESVGNNRSTTKSPALYDIHTADVYIPENKNWSTTTTPVYRDIAITAFYGQSTGSMPNNGGTKTVEQPGYYISGATHTVTSFTPGVNTPVPIKLTGAFDERPVRALDTTNQREIASGSVPASETENSTTLLVPPSGSWAPAEIMMQYQHGVNGWIPIQPTVTMDGYNLTVTAQDTVPHANGFAVKVTGHGYGPDIKLRPLISDDQKGKEVTLPAGVSGNRTKEVIVPPNVSSASRTVEIQWLDPRENNGDSAWVTLATYTQPRTYMTQTGALIGRENVYASTWAEAAGIPLKYNSEDFEEVTNVLNKDVIIRPTEATGCGAYSEPGFETGWRLPTYNEIYDSLRHEDATADNPHVGKVEVWGDVSHRLRSLWTTTQSLGNRVVGLWGFEAEQFFRKDSNGHADGPNEVRVWARCVHDLE